LLVFVFDNPFADAAATFEFFPLSLAMAWSTMLAKSLAMVVEV
jgi:hypothetical protein